MAPTTNSTPLALEDISRLSMRKVGEMRIWLPLAALMLLTTPQAATSQVVITTGVQEIYDDNIFLENNQRRPSPVVADDALDLDIAEDGSVSVFNSEQADGKTNDDLITNVFISLSGEIPYGKKYADSSFENRVGALFFGDFSDQNRLTLDSIFESNLAKQFLPEPYYLGVRAQIGSESGDATVATGSSARLSQNLTSSLRAGIENYDLSDRVKGDLGYTGTLHTFLGTWRFDDTDERFDEEGSDYHSHIASASIKRQINNQLTLGVNANGGTQLYFDVNSNDPTEPQSDDLDRNIADSSVFAQYSATDRLIFNGSVGIGYSELQDDPQPRQKTFINNDGKAQVITVQGEKDQTALIFSGNMFYGFEPGSTINSGLQQEISQDIDGQSITTRSVFTNITKAFGDRFSVTAGGTFIQFSSEDDVSDSTDRWETSLSANYQLTQTVSLVLGYNYVNQDASSASLEDQLRFLSQDYEVNRVFVGINGGFVGLPL